MTDFIGDRLDEFLARGLSAQAAADEILARAAADAPTVRPDGKFVLTEAVCRVCGCTDACACAGGCVWVEPNLCSRCVPGRRRPRRR